MGRDETSTPEYGPLPPDSDGLFFVFFAFRTRVHLFSLWVLGSPLHETWAPGPGLSLAPEKASLAHPPAIDTRRSCPEGWGGPGCLGSEPPTGFLQGSSRTPSWVPGVPPAAGTSGNCLVLTAQPCSRPKGGDWEGHCGERGCRGHEGQSVYPEHEWSCGVRGTKGQVCGQTMPENPPFQVGARCCPALDHCPLPIPALALHMSRSIHICSSPLSCPPPGCTCPAGGSGQVFQVSPTGAGPKQESHRGEEPQRWALAAKSPPARSAHCSTTGCSWRWFSEAALPLISQRRALQAEKPRESLKSHRVSDGDLGSVRACVLRQ